MMIVVMLMGGLMLLAGLGLMTARDEVLDQ
jgi:hypothetical protein